jgi:Fe2+ transport system protein B
MKKFGRHTGLITRMLIVVFAASVAMGTGGCKSKKKLAEEAAAKEYAEKVEAAIAELNAILNDDGTMPIAEMERRLNDIKAQNLNDARVNDLIRQVEEKIAAAKEAERLRQEELEKQKQMEMEREKYDYVDEYFRSVAASTTAEEANAKIAQALKLFVSPDAPVLIIISQEGDITDYDKPTTAENYLNYLKDTKSYDEEVYEVQMDDYGQIKSLELIKK